MANLRGHHTHGTKGNKFARKRKLSIDFNGLEELTERINELQGDLEKIIGGAMEKAGATVQADTLKAIENPNLPAKGKYSHGETKKSVVKDVHVKWGGSVGEMPLGFDKTVEGAGGWLITGTPKMSPDRALSAIYSDKRSSRAYEQRIKKQIRADLEAALAELESGQ